MEEDKNNLLGIGNLSFDDVKKIDREKIKNCHTKDLQPFLNYSEWRCFEQVIGKLINLCKISYSHRTHRLLQSYEWTSAMKSLEEGSLEDLCKTALQCHLDRISKQLSFRVSKIHAHSRHYFSLHELLTQKAKYSTFEVKNYEDKVLE